MSEMSYQLKYMHEDAEKIGSLFAVTITNQDGKKVPTVIMVTDTLSEEQKEEMRKRLWEIAGILREARAQPASVPDEVSVALGVVNDAANDSRHRGDYDRANALVQARIALWRAAQPASVPDGWVMVPRKPTGDMILAGISENNRDTGPHVFGRIYAAMLKAAPQPPAKEGE